MFGEFVAFNNTIAIYSFKQAGMDLLAMAVPAPLGKAIGYSVIKIVNAADLGDVAIFTGFDFNLVDNVAKIKKLDKSALWRTLLRMIPTYELAKQSSSDSWRVVVKYPNDIAYEYRCSYIGGTLSVWNDVDDLKIDGDIDPILRDRFIRGIEDDRPIPQLELAFYSPKMP